MEFAIHTLKSFQNGLGLAHYTRCIVQFVLSGSPDTLPNNIMGKGFDHSNIHYFRQWSFVITFINLIDLEHITTRNIKRKITNNPFNLMMHFIYFLTQQHQQSTNLINKSNECILHGSWWWYCYQDKRPQVAHKKSKIYIYTTCFLSPNSVFKQSSFCTSLLLILLLFRLLSFSPSLPSFLATFLQALGK